MIECERSILKRVRRRIKTAKQQQEKREKEKNELSQQPPATIPQFNRAREQAEWKEEKGKEANASTKRLSTTILSTILLYEHLSTILLDELRASASKISATPRQRKIAIAYLEAREAR